MSTQKTVRHAHKGLRKGFTMVPNILLLDPTLSAGAVRVYGVFNYLAWAVEDEWPGQDKLGETFLGIADAKTVRKFLGELEERGLIKSIRRGRGLANLYEVFLPEEAQIQNGKNPRSRAGKIPQPEREETTPPNSEEKTEASDEAANAASSSASTTKTSPAGAQVIKFRGRQVPLDVFCTAAALLDTFNSLANTSYPRLTSGGRPTESLKRILGAILDHPEISLELGERMIRIQLADPYWTKGPAQPGNVFGPNVVERNIEAAAWTPNTAGNGASLIDRLDARRAA